MDKEEFVYSVNGLRDAGSAGKTLYSRRTEAGQEMRLHEKTLFCTFGAVDMQAFFHRRELQGCRTVSAEGADGNHGLGDVVEQTGFGMWLARCWRHSIEGAAFFFCRQARACAQLALVLSCGRGRQACSLCFCIS